jgi:hypothetical protein
MGVDDVFNIGFSNNFNTTTYASKTPTKLGLNAKNAFYVAAGAAGSPSAAVPANWAKIFTIKVAPATGVLTGTLTITDSVPVTGKPNKTVTRKLTLAGVMLRPATIGSEAFAVGSVTIPPLDPKTGSAITAAFTFSGPYETAPLVVSAAAIAGNYHGTFTLIDGTFGAQPPAGTPTNNQVVNFSIASDLKSMVFNGRTVPLSGDARPLNLHYLSMGNPKLSITLTFSLVDGSMTHCAAYYILGSQGSFTAISKASPPIVKDGP